MPFICESPQRSADLVTVVRKVSYAAILLPSTSTVHGSINSSLLAYEDLTAIPAQLGWHVSVLNRDWHLVAHGKVHTLSSHFCSCSNFDAASPCCIISVDAMGRRLQDESGNYLVVWMFSLLTVRFKRYLIHCCYFRILSIVINHCSENG
jgi:hypothetical protein